MTQGGTHASCTDEEELVFLSKLALKHRQGKNHKMRIIAFVGSPVEDNEKDVSPRQPSGRAGYIRQCPEGLRTGQRCWARHLGVVDV